MQSAELQQGLQTLWLAEHDRPRLLNWNKTKCRWAKSLGCMPRSSEIAEAYQSLVGQGLLKLEPAIELSLQVKRLRTQSGVVPFAVMMKAHPCPGKCTFCVQEPGLPKSYMSDEPAAQRALLHNFDPAAQVLSRLEQLTVTGHRPEKLQIIVIGGTFSSYPDNYKRSFIKGIFDACNGAISATMKEAQELNESAAHRVIGLSIETRPDWVNPDEIALLRECGVTKVQLGVQTLEDAVNVRTNRGHTVADVVRATGLLRDAGFKINHHLMPNLPGATPESDLESVRQLFANPGLRPDTIKLYPCIVIPKTPLFVQWQRGEYQSYDDETLAELMAQSKALVPAYCRIDRLVRDITRKWTASGTTKTNLRDLVQKNMASKGLNCICIRCREIRSDAKMSSTLLLKQQNYEANGGQEIFLSFECAEKGKLYGMLRLRLPSQSDTALVRELQVFGRQVQLGTAESQNAQHQKLGSKLLAEAEKITLSRGYTRLSIISGVGVRGYYRKRGYRLDNTYMIKKLKPTS